MPLLDWAIVGLVPAAFLLAAFVVGAAVGSGLNVLIYRLPRGQSPFWPPSSCGVCRSRIRWHDNVPVLGYLRLRGRCRDCGTRFSPRYMVVELVTGLGFAGLLALNLFREGRGAITGEVSPAVWLSYLLDAYLFSLTVMQFCCRLDGPDLPASVALPGLVAGPLAAALTQLGLAGWLAGLAAGWLLARPLGTPGDVVFLVTVGGLLGWPWVTVAALPALLFRCLGRTFGTGLAVGVGLALLGGHALPPIIQLDQPTVFP